VFLVSRAAAPRVAVAAIPHDQPGLLTAEQPRKTPRRTLDRTSEALVISARLYVEEQTRTPPIYPGGVLVCVLLRFSVTYDLGAQAEHCPVGRQNGLSRAIYGYAWINYYIVHAGA
jgi:hypothetical protein